MQLTIGVDVFSRMCGQKADTSSNIVTIFSHMTRDTSVFVKCDMVFRLFFSKLPQIRTSNSRKVVQQHTKGIIRALLLFRAVKEF